MPIRLDALSDENGLVTYSGQPYTGVVYAVEPNGLILRTFCVAAGKEICPYEHWSEGFPLVDNQFLDWDHDDPLPRWQDKPFRGIACEFFPNGILEFEWESYKVDGLEVFSRRWNEDGSLGTVAISRDEKTWYSNGQLMAETDPIRRVYFSREGKLSGVVLKDAYRGSFFDDYTSTVAESLELEGNVDDAFLCQLRGLESLTQLVLNKTKITTRGIQAFAVCSRLKKLIVEGNVFSIDDIRNATRHLADLEIFDVDAVLRNAKSKGDPGV